MCRDSGAVGLAVLQRSVVVRCVEIVVLLAYLCWVDLLRSMVVSCAEMVVMLAVLGGSIEVTGGTLCRDGGAVGCGGRSY